MFDGFASARISVGDTEIFVRHGGFGPPVLLLHGFPETHLMWRDIAPILAKRFSLVCADLRGYGASGCPASDDDHAPYAKRAMAADMVHVMAALGHSRFSVVGHDRGGRVAYRMAIDHPGAIDRLAVLDVVAGADAWDRADDRLAIAFWPWSLLAQPAPLPETLLVRGADAIIDNALGAWGSPAGTFPDDVRKAYVDALSDPAHAAAICEEYRAAAGIDRDHDAADRAAGRRITCPLLALWSSDGGLSSWYDDEGGPLGLWRQWADDVQGVAMPGGHFFPEEHPRAAADALGSFLAVRLSS